MFAFFAENFGTVAVGLGLAGAVAAIAFSMIRNKKKGRCAGCAGCGGECAARTHTYSQM